MNIGMASASRLNGSPLGVMTATTTKMTTIAKRRAPASCCGVQHADELEEHEEDRELEADAEAQHHQHDEAEVLRRA